MTNKDTKTFFQQVEEFQLAFNHPVAEKPTPLDLGRVAARGVWEVEEVIEGIHAASSNQEEFNKAVDTLIEGVEKAREKSLGEEFPSNDIERIVALADAFTDSLYFNQGNFVELGLKPEKLFEIVQNSNMSKLFTDEEGNKFAKYRESDGKIMKSPEFFPPEEKLKEEVLRQIEESKN